MTISTPDAVGFGFLVNFAEEMYVQGSVTPKPEPRIAAAGWDVVGHFLARDAIFPDPLRTPKGQRRISLAPDTVFYGFLVRAHADATRFAAVIRGTAGFAEWVIDGEFMPVPAPFQPGAMIEQGFSDIYGSMTLVGLDGQRIGRKAADGIAEAVGRGTVTVTGHSLGSSLATYLSFEVAKLLGPRMQACLFASPRTGDRAWVAAYAATVKTYRLFNYALDVVPYVPCDLGPAIQYSPLPRAEVIEPATAQAVIKFDVGCNHHVICYCAMIDYAETKARQSPQDASAWACIVGKPGPGLERDLTVSLGTAVTALDDARRTVVDLLWATHRAKNAAPAIA